MTTEHSDPPVQQDYRDAPAAPRAGRTGKREAVQEPRRLGRFLLLLTAGAVAGVAISRARSPAPRPAASRNPSPPRASVPQARPPGVAPERSPARLVRGGAAILAGSVLFDSAMEHFRGGWHDRKMYAAPSVALGALVAATRGGDLATIGHGAALLTGIAGSAFHLRNVARRPGGFTWNNLFYAAPLGAPAALSTAGMLGLMATGIDHRGPRRRDAQALAAVTSAALWGEAAEVGLLHFRGAFHDPFMYLPIVISPATGVAMALQAMRPGAAPKTTRRLLGTTAALGVLGTAFHVIGVGRNMGGWRNWRQTALAGPPVPAPASFTGIALAGFAALELIRATRHTS